MRILLFLFFCGSLMASVEEKIGQLLMTYFNGEEVNEDARILIEDLYVGGIIYYTWANGLSSKSQVQNLSAALRSLSPHPLLIGVDQEGGRISRLKGDFFVSPSAASIQDARAAFFLANAMGIELKEVGINLNFAPVVDLNCNPQNIVIGDRSFGNDLTHVTELGGAFAQGLIEAGVNPCLKHFPGHGDVAMDSHFSVPVVDKSRAELDAYELYPYQKLLHKAPCIMTAHTLFPQLDAEFPSTFSKKILTGILREEMGYEGAIITDSLKMQGALDGNLSMGEAAIRSFLAGADILLIGGKLLLDADDNEHMDEVREVRDALVQAVLSGRISEERLDASLRIRGRLFQDLPLYKERDLVDHHKSETVTRPGGNL